LIVSPCVENKLQVNDLCDENSMAESYDAVIKAER
jgi:hypothetical protein